MKSKETRKPKKVIIKKQLKTVTFVTFWESIVIEKSKTDSYD